MYSERSHDGFSEKVRFTCKTTTEMLINMLSCLEGREKNGPNISFPLLYDMRMTADLIPDWATLIMSVAAAIVEVTGPRTLGIEHTGSRSDRCHKV